VQIDTIDGVLKISGTLDIGVAGELHRALRGFLETARNPVLDLSEVDGCDVTGLQLLYSARKTAQGSSKALQFTGVSGPLEHSFGAAGLAAGDWITPL
jgi:anti-anti-sigma factor